MKSQKLAIYLPDYEKIFRILHGVTVYTNKNAPPSCLFFNVVGALILNSQYGIQARPMLGAAFIVIDDATGHTLAFADDFETCSSSEKGFHCWIETPTHYIDFTAPLYSEYPNSKPVPRLMFQKHRNKMKTSPQGLYEPGDFYFEPNIPLTMDRLKAGKDSFHLNDFANIALEWANKSQKSLLDNMFIQADDGEIVNLKTSPIKLSGIW